MFQSTSHGADARYSRLCGSCNFKSEDGWGTGTGLCKCFSVLDSRLWSLWHLLWFDETLPSLSFLTHDCPARHSKKCVLTWLALCIKSLQLERNDTEWLWTLCSFRGRCHKTCCNIVWQWLHLCSPLRLPTCLKESFCSSFLCECWSCVEPFVNNELMAF